MTEKLSWRPVAFGEGWVVSEVLCCSGPADRPQEEQHSKASIAIVAAGTFQYRSSLGRELMTPGSLMLGNPGQSFECGHEHAVGDRCISFVYDPQFVESLASEANICTQSVRFPVLRIPAVREFSRLVARANAGLARPGYGYVGKRNPSNRFSNSTSISVKAGEWEEIAFQLAIQALDFVSLRRADTGSHAAAEARVTRVVRMIEDRYHEDLSLVALAAEARLSRYHFLRTFEELTGLTPHKYIRRVRLRRAACQLILESSPILDIVFDSGFGDVSNFNHAFLAEFGVSPRSYRRELVRNRAS